MCLSTSLLPVMNGQITTSNHTLISTSNLWQKLLGFAVSVIIIQIHVNNHPLGMYALFFFLYEFCINDKAAKSPFNIVALDWMI